MIGIGNNPQVLGLSLFGRLALLRHKQFKRMSEAMDHPEWTSSPEYATNDDRLKNKSALIHAMSEILLTRTTAEWTDAFRGKGSVTSISLCFC
jgi:crotonobetainyl-CoA:carnitine CoA-transferase CaiB-like acyl-CoA transferase